MKPVHAVAEETLDQADMDDDMVEYTVHSAFCLGTMKGSSRHLPKCKIHIDKKRVTA